MKKKLASELSRKGRTETLISDERIFGGREVKQECINETNVALAVSPEMTALRILGATGVIEDSTPNTVVKNLFQHLQVVAKSMCAGNLFEVESMLINQAQALQALFTYLTERGMGSNDERKFELNLKIALRAQAQCRANLEVLAGMKTPSIVYAHQANVTSGLQQINNHSSSVIFSAENPKSAKPTIRAEV